MTERSQEFYARLSPFYDELFGCDSSIVEFLVAHGAVAGVRALDIACGSGACARELLRRGVDVYGVDLSADLIFEAHRLAVGATAPDGGRPAGAPAPGNGDRSSASRFIVGDMLEVDRLPAAPFGFAYCIGNSVSHLPDAAAVERFAGSLSRAVRPGGTAVVQYVATEAMPPGSSRDLPDLTAPGVRFRRIYRRESADHVLFDAILEIEAGVAAGGREGPPRADSQRLQQRLLVIRRAAILTALERNSFVESRVYGGFGDSPPTADSWVEVVVARRR